MSDTKKCPYCAEDIKEEAIKCKHCGEFLEKDHAIKERVNAKKVPNDKFENSETIGLLILFIPIISIIISWIFLKEITFEPQLFYPISFGSSFVMAVLASIESSKLKIGKTDSAKKKIIQEPGPIGWFFGFLIFNALMSIYYFTVRAKYKMKDYSILAIIVAVIVFASNFTLLKEVKIINTQSNTSAKIKKIVPLQDDTRKNHKNPEMVLVPGSKFQTTLFLDDYPFLKDTIMYIDAFYMGKYEIIQAQWEEVMKNNPSFFKGNNKPIETISWYEAVNFCNKLSEINGLQNCYNTKYSEILCDYNANGYRLPTVYEFNYALEGNVYDLDYIDNSNSSAKGTYPIGQYQPNNLGLYDMVGNVWEFTNKQNNELAPYKIMGDGWNGSADGTFYWSDGKKCDPYVNPYENYNFVGFRVVKSAD